MNKQSKLPGEEVSGNFTLALSNQLERIGWLGVSETGYGIVVDARNAMILQTTIEGGKLYFYYETEAGNRYMSVSNELLSYQISFGTWLDATDFALRGGMLTSNYNGKPLSVSSGALYANSGLGYTTLNVVQQVDPVIRNPPLTATIEHVIVVMMENRSFDNVLGGLYPEKTKNGQFRGLTGTETNPLDPNDPSKGTVGVFQADPTTDSSIIPYPDPGELFDDMNAQLFGPETPRPNVIPTMNGFAWNYSNQPGAPIVTGGPNVDPVPKNVMQYFKEGSVPMSYFLAKQFAVCDNWFAAAPVQTLCNRMMAQSGTPGLVPGTNEARLNNPDFKPTKIPQFPYYGPVIHDKTVFQLLDEAYPGQVNWKVYYHDSPLASLNSYVYNNWDYTNYSGGNVYQFWPLTETLTNLENDIIAGQLPKYSFIEPLYADGLNNYRVQRVNSSHPGGAGINTNDANGAGLPPPVSVTDGEALLKQLYEILVKHMETFKKTLFVVIYDEHGGCYDHVPPPNAVSPFTNAPVNFDYNRYGVRIPAMLINPGIPPGTIYPSRDRLSRTPFDHTSLISTLTAQFGLEPNLTPRSASAPTLTNLIPNEPLRYNRPAAPYVPPNNGELLAQNDLKLPTFNLEAAMNTIANQKNAHSLAAALVPLAYIAQQGKQDKK